MVEVVATAPRSHGAQELVFVEHEARIRRSFASSTIAGIRRPLTPNAGRRGSWRAGQASTRSGVGGSSASRRQLTPSRQDRRRAQRKEPDHRPHLEPLRRAVGQAQRHRRTRPPRPRAHLVFVIRPSPRR